MVDDHKFQRGAAAFKPDSKRSEKIHGFGEDYKKDTTFDQVDFISQESIAKAILKPCCAGECLRKKLNTAAGYSCLNFESVFSKVLTARKQLVGNDFKDRVLILKTIIQGKCYFSLMIIQLLLLIQQLFIHMDCTGGVVSSGKKSSQMRVKYKLGYDKCSPSICPTAFCNAYGITSYLRKRLKREVKEGLFHLESNNLEFYDHDVVEKEQLKEIKALLKKSTMKLPKELGVNMQLPRSIPILQVYKY